MILSIGSTIFPLHVRKISRGDPLKLDGKKRETVNAMIFPIKSRRATKKGYVDLLVTTSTTQFFANFRIDNVGDLFSALASAAVRAKENFD